MKDASAAAVLDYLKALAGARDDSDLAKIIGYSKQALSTARKRGKTSLKMLAKASICFEKSVEEIISGALAFELAVDGGPAGKYAYPIFQFENDTEEKNCENTSQQRYCGQNNEALEACTANDLPSRLVKLRNGQSRRAFAEQMGTTESTLRNYEKGVSSPTADFLRTVCQNLRITPEWLLLGKENLENKGGQFVLPAALAEATKITCPGCLALERVLKLEREERQALAKENTELREQLAQLKERLKQTDEKGDTAPAPPMAHTA